MIEYIQDLMNNFCVCVCVCVDLSVNQVGYTVFRFSCVRQCDQGDYPSLLGVCEHCDMRCDSCVGPGAFNCTSCPPSRYYIIIVMMLTKVASFQSDVCLL